MRNYFGISRDAILYLARNDARLEVTEGFPQRAAYDLAFDGYDDLLGQHPIDWTVLSDDEKDEMLRQRSIIALLYSWAYISVFRRCQKHYEEESTLPPARPIEKILEDVITEGKDREMRHAAINEADAQWKAAQARM